MSAEDQVDRSSESSSKESSRFLFFIGSSVISIGIFLLFATVMLMVPGVLPSEKITMLTIATVVAGISVSVAVWKFGSTDAPIMRWPIGSLLSVVLVLVLVYCILNIVILSVSSLR